MTAMDPARPETAGESPVKTPRGSSYTETRDFGVAVALGVFAVGALVGAAAVILAPSGMHTRRQLGRRIRWLGRRDRTPWEKLRRTLDRAAKQRRAAKRAASLATASDDVVVG